MTMPDSRRSRLSVKKRNTSIINMSLNSSRALRSSNRAGFQKCEGRLLCSRCLKRHHVASSAVGTHAELDCQTACAIPDCWGSILHFWITRLRRPPGNKTRLTLLVGPALRQKQTFRFMTVHSKIERRFLTRIFNFPTRLNTKRA